MADLDTKALEAACLAFNGAPGFTWERVEAAVRAYLSALPSTSEEMAGMVKRLRGLAEQIRIDDLPAMPGIEEQSGAMAEAATMLEALDAELRTLKDML